MRKKNKIEFSKILVAWAVVITTACVLASYVLAIFGLDVCSDVTVAVITTCVAIAVSYEAKSFGEKNSRNRYGIGIDGTTVNTACDEEVETDEEALG